MKKYAFILTAAVLVITASALVLTGKSNAGQEDELCPIAINPNSIFTLSSPRVNG